MKFWRSRGQITADGYLRVPRHWLTPWTMKKLEKVAPQLGVFDRLAALIDLNGVVERRYMANPEHQNIREVVEAIADKRVAIRLQDGDTSLLLKDMIRAEVAAIFGEVRDQVRGTVPVSPAGRGGNETAAKQNKCSKCHVPGHRATTCRATGPAAPDKWACIPCSDKEHRPLTDPVTHPLKSEEFHKNDERAAEDLA